MTGHYPSRLCERCHKWPDSWFFDGGYVCTSCMDQWTVVLWVFDLIWGRVK